MGRDPGPLRVPGSSRPHSHNFRGEPVCIATGRTQVVQNTERRRPLGFVSRYRSIAVTVQVRPFLVLKVMSS
jgi:hypothetical protein